MESVRKSGVLMHISSLPSEDGIGTMGQTARDFVDFLVRSQQSYWQILPVGPTSYGDSPYQSFSSFAGNPYFIDLRELCNKGLIDYSDYSDIDWENTPDSINYGVLYNKRYPILKKAVKKLLENGNWEYEEFCRVNSDWLEDYALFMAIKDKRDGHSWTEWEEPLKKRQPDALNGARAEYAEAVNFWKGVQFLFRSQWNELKGYANDRGISIIGDIPIYVALDSVDVWSHPELFLLNEELEPVDVAGCPPDGFSATGQLWGNPLFRWDVMAADGYSWWCRRIKEACSIYDVLRIDHFRGFESYYAIPYGDENAIRGQWRKGPGIELFRAVERTIGRQNIIAEDLGYLTDSVRAMLRESGFPGMKVLEFAFDSRDNNNSDYLPHNYPVHSVAYAGTHDNDTICGWMNTADSSDVDYAREYLRLGDKEPHWDMIKALWATTSELTIIQAQDILGLGSESRMNIPSTLGCNWKWRALPGAFNDEVEAKLRDCTRLYGRV